MTNSQFEAGNHCCKCCHQSRTQGQRLLDTPQDNLSRPGYCSAQRCSKMLKKMLFLRLPCRKNWSYEVLPAAPYKLALKPNFGKVFKFETKLKKLGAYNQIEILKEERRARWLHLMWYSHNIVAFIVDNWVHIIILT